MPLHQVRNPFARAGLILAAAILIVIGVIGLVAPIIPGVVFLALAATLLARGSPRFNRWLQRQRWYRRFRARDGDGG